jgi:hypothetical protein
MNLFPPELSRLIRFLLTLSESMTQMHKLGLVKLYSGLLEEIVVLKLDCLEIVNDV